MVFSVLVPSYGKFCNRRASCTHKMRSIDHKTLWEGHATMIHEAARQLPSGVVPDAVLCSVGGGGLLGGVIRGMNDVGWDQSVSPNLGI